MDKITAAVWVAEVALRKALELVKQDTPIHSELVQASEHVAKAGQLTVKESPYEGLARTR